MNPSFRCRLTSLGLDEQLRATATHAPTWLLLEEPGPWGEKALEGGRLPVGLRAALARSSKAAGVRVNLIRRHFVAKGQRNARSAGAGTHVYLADTRTGWLAGTLLADPHEALGLDLAALARGERPGLAGVPLREHDGPLFLVCTHGRHDPCCAENGRPVARALSARFPSRTWESTHLGGDRFAANLACFPHGLYFGRVPAEEVGEIAQAYHDGSIRLDHYRGRTCWPGPVQAAEFWAREDAGRTGTDDVAPVGVEQDGDLTTVTLDVAGERRVVRVRERADENARLVKCHATEISRPVAYELVELLRAPTAARQAT